MSRRSNAETGIEADFRSDGGGGAQRGSGWRHSSNGESTPLLNDSPSLPYGSDRDRRHGDADESGEWRDETLPRKQRPPPPPALRTLESFSGGTGTKLATSLCCWDWASRRLTGYMLADNDLNIYSWASLAIVMSYFSVGVALELLSTPVAYYLIDDLGAESGVYTVWVVLVALPWSFKVLYGFISDCVPIRGLKRKPYMLIGWMVHIISNAILAIMVTPSAVWTVVLSFASACGYLLSDVMTDAIVVEKTKRESMGNMGNIQASGYIARYFGSALGAIGGAVLYNKDTWGWGLSISTLFWINGLVPLLLVIPLMPFLFEEPKTKETGVLKRHMDELWILVQKKAVWRPMIFVYLYNALMIPNSSWTNYLVETLDFSDWDVGVVNIASQVFAWMGLIIYAKWMGDMSWSNVYLVTTLISFICSITQLLLILGISSSWGIPDLLFASGDEAASNVVLALQFLPVTRMYAVMCPNGSEGTSYALLTTVSNVAYEVAYTIGDLLTDLGGEWSTSNSTLLAGDMSGMWRLTVLTSCIAVTPVALVWLLPQNKKQQLELQKSSETSVVWGKIFLYVTFGSILFTIVESIWELVDAV